MAIIDLSAGNIIAYDDTVLAESEIVLDSYGSLEEANVYFDNRLRSQDWKTAEIQDKKAALIEATELIDRLAFIGTKASDSQIHEFPRTNVGTPEGISKACYEIALKLIEGYDPNLEIDNLAAVSQGFSSVRETYDRTFVLDHIRAGIPSAKAWGFLQPYLAATGGISLRRV